MIASNHISNWRSKLTMHNILNWSVPVIAAVSLFFMSQYSFLLFHTVAELFIIAVAWSIFIIVWNARRISDNYYFLFLGIGCLFVGLVDLLHVLAYQGMPIFRGYDANLPTQLWIAWQYLLTVSFCGAIIFINRRFSPEIVLLGFLVITVIVVTMIFGGWFPDCFLETTGLTWFKKLSEIFTAAAIAGSIYPLWQQKHRFSSKVLNLLICSIAFSVSAKTAFIFYVDVYGLSNLIGHYLMLAAFFCMYKAVVETGIAEPAALLFKTLKDRELELVTASSALQAATQYLEQTVENRTRELEQTNHKLLTEIEERKQIQALLTRKNNELEKINRQLDDFACVVSHDLREPIRGIYNYCRILIQDHGHQLDSEAQLLIERIASKAQLQEQQIQALINYARLDQYQPEKNLTDLNTLIHNILDDMHDIIHRSGATIRFHQPLPSAQCNPALMELVYRNLISNALKYNDKSEKWVEIGAELNPSGNIEFYVKDNGIGIEERHFPLVFKMLKRLHPPHSFEGGIGAGLAIVYKIIEYHQGQIRLTSQPGKGTAFFFTLPDKQNWNDGSYTK